MYSFGAMLSFTIAHFAVIQLRRSRPDEDRLWKPPLNVRMLGVEVPVSAVVGGFGTFTAWIVVMALNPRTLAIGLGWMAFGIAVYLLYRRSQRLPLTETVKVVLPEPLGVEEVEYRSVLVGFSDDREFSPEMVATAVKLASKRRRGIHVHSMMTVPTNLPLDAKMPERETEAQSKVEEAKLIGGQRVTGHVARVRPGQAGYSVADEAAEIKAEAIVVGLRYRNGVPLYDKTLQTVLGERPCRVIVVSDPSDKPAAIPGAALAEASR
jgi:APA family basic amino acid/polyamine antiporter